MDLSKADGSKSYWSSLLILFCLLTGGAAIRAAEVEDVEPRLPSVAERVFIASSIYAAIPQHFAHWDDAGDLDLESAYRDYLETVVTVDNRRDFSLATKALLALLNNGHTRFSDSALTRDVGRELNFSLRYLDRDWTVVESGRTDLAVGDVVGQIDGQEFEAFFQQQLRYVSHSTERWARYAMFDNRARSARYLLPLRFSLTLEDGRVVEVDRQGESQQVERETRGRWLVPERIAYLKIPRFSPAVFEKRALELVDEYASAEGLVIDLRGNSGGNTPGSLTRRLMDRRYPWWLESTPVKFGSLGFDQAQLSWKPWWNEPAEDPFVGSVVLLIDAGCFSACEDFAMPFKHTGRALLIGETTGGSSGQPHFIRFDDGMVALIGSKREHFPDGSQFESVGISPDIELVPTVEQLREGMDPLLERALEELLQTVDSSL